MNIHSMSMKAVVKRFNWISSRRPWCPICGRIGDNEAPGLGGIRNKALKLTTKTRPEWLTSTSDLCLVKKVFPVRRSWFC